MKKLYFATLLGLSLGIGFNNLKAAATEFIVERQAQLVIASKINNLEKEARAFYQQGKYQQAIELLNRAIDYYLNEEDLIGEAIAWRNLALVYQKLANWKQAELASEQSLKRLELLEDSQTRKKLKAQALDVLGQIHLAQGQSQEALTTWQTAINIYEEIGDLVGLTGTKINLAQALQDLGLYPRACQTLLAALKIDISRGCRELTPKKLEEERQVLQKQPASLVKVQGWRNLGEVLRVLGQTSQSKIVLEASLNAAKQLEYSSDNKAEMAAIYLSLGNTALAQKNRKDAWKYYQQADTESASTTTQIQSQLKQLSLSLSNSANYSPATQLIGKIESKLTQLPASRQTIYARIYLARQLIDYQARPNSGSLTTESRQALQLLATAIQQARELEDKRAEAHALGNLGYLYEQYQRYNEAQELTEKALLISQRLNLPELDYQWQWQLGRIFQQQAKQTQTQAEPLIFQSITAYNQAVESLKSIRGDLVALNPEIQFTFRDSVEPVYRQYVDLLLRSDNPTQDNLKRARDAIEALQLAELNDFFRDICLEDQPQQIDEVVDRASPRVAAFYTIILGNRLAVILKLPEPNKSPEEQKLHYQSIYFQGEEELETLEVLERHLRRDPERVNDIKKLSGKVYGWLIKPFEAELQSSKVKTLVFILDAPLRNIPMAVLYDADRQKYLLEKYAIALTPGLQLLSPRPFAEVSRQNVLTAGISEAVEVEVEGQTKALTFPKLSKVEEELEAIFPELRPESQRAELLNDKFTQTNFQEQLTSASFSVVHIATHGQFSSEPDQTYILAWKKLLKIEDLENLIRRSVPNQSSPIELLILSACETAKGDKRATLGLAGMAVRAGARSTLATLWPVRDESTAKLMQEFYRQLKNNPQITKAEALQQAQLALWKNETLEWYLPYFWASYVLVGNWL